jgi:hypothetical protein
MKLTTTRLTPSISSFYAYINPHKANDTYLRSYFHSSRSNQTKWPANSFCVALLRLRALLVWTLYVAWRLTLLLYFLPTTTPIDTQSIYACFDDEQDMITIEPHDVHFTCFPSDNCCHS